MNRRYRKTIIAGNWKMNMTASDTKKFADDIKAIMPRAKWCDVVVCVPFVNIPAALKAFKDLRISVGAQNMFYEKSGAYTGEVSAQMIASLGVEYVILGHSERRQYYGETSATLNKKMEQAYANNLAPIYCVGENLEEREAGKHFDVVRKQIEEVVFNLTPDQFKKLIIAYEPVWAIGTGKTATAAQAQEMHAFIRKTLADKYGKEVAENCSILYGGSCKPSNAKELFANPDVDGGLIGGAALEVDSFMGIIEAF